jgi:hypothetical protein
LSDLPTFWVPKIEKKSFSKTENIFKKMLKTIEEGNPESE